MGSMGQELPDWDVVVVGGGFCGTWLLKHLRDEGFKVHLFEHGFALGGIWYWNNYPGARVDTSTPSYQLMAKETWNTWEWKQFFPGRDELVSYFVGALSPSYCRLVADADNRRCQAHIARVWDLNKDISFNSEVTALHWEANSARWRYEINKGETSGTASFVVCCTGFAAKRYIPPWEGIDSFKGTTLHTSRWPQSGFNLDGQRVAVIGTGATGVQTIQEVAQKAAHLTVFQRTPNTALPMANPLQTSATNRAMREGFEETKKKMQTTFAGFDYEFATGKPSEIPKEERFATYEKLYNAGGLQLWLGTYVDSLYVEEYNEELYQFWRSKTLPRIKDKRNQELLAPEKKIHPFGTKRISLEVNYFECFNQDNVELLSVREDTGRIEKFTEKGILTGDGKEHEFDTIIFATGFDTHTGGLTQIDLRGLSNRTMADKWKDGVYTHLGIACAGFPNFFFCYGPQAPTAFATGPSHAETQGNFIVDCLKHMRENKFATIDATEEAESKYKVEIDEIAARGLFSQAEGWYFGTNIPGKKKEALNFMGGMPLYRQKLVDEGKNGYPGFVLSR